MYFLMGHNFAIQSHQNTKFWIIRHRPEVQHFRFKIAHPRIDDFWSNMTILHFQPRTAILVYEVKSAI